MVSYTQSPLTFETNCLRVEQPVGTGFSTGTPTAQSEDDIARDFLNFFRNFQDKFGIKNYKIYVTGESYAGRYIPYISSAMLDQKNKEYFDLHGAIIYDGCIGQYNVIQEDMTIVPFIKANPQYFPFDAGTLTQLENKHVQCGYDKYIDQYLQFPATGVQPPAPASCSIFNDAYSAAQQANSCFNIYEVNTTCPTPNDPLQPTSGQPYFDRADVKAAMHAPSSVTWAECAPQSVFLGGLYGVGGPEGEGDLSPDPIQGVLPHIIEGTNRVLIANGDLDMIIITNGSLLSIQNMTWNGQLGFQSKPADPIMIDGKGNMGIQHQERGLMWTETFFSGHMGPQYQPEVAYKQLQWLLGYIDSL
jgi:carboxypeptidase D